MNNDRSDHRLLTTGLTSWPCVEDTLTDYLKVGFDRQARSLTPQAGVRDIFKIDPSSMSSSEWHFQWLTRLTFAIVYWSLIIVHWNRFAGTHPLAPYPFRWKREGKALISSFYGFHDIDIEYISLLITAFLGSSLKGLFQMGLCFIPGLKPGAMMWTIPDGTF